MLDQEEFFVAAFEAICGISRLKGKDKKFIEFIKKHGACLVFAGSTIEDKDFLALMQELLAMFYKGLIPHFEIILCA